MGVIVQTSPAPLNKDLSIPTREHLKKLKFPKGTCNHMIKRAISQSDVMAKEATVPERSA